MYITPVNNVIYFRAKTTENEKDKKKVTPQEAAVATGAAGATGSAIAGKSTMKSFSEFNKKANTTAKNVKAAVETANETTTKAKSVLGKFAGRCQHYKDGMIKFGENLKNSNLLKPILTSGVYKGAAAVTGFATASLVTVAGVGDIFNTFAKRTQQFTEE